MSLRVIWCDSRSIKLSNILSDSLFIIFSLKYLFSVDNYFCKSRNHLLSDYWFIQIHYICLTKKNNEFLAKGIVVHYLIIANYFVILKYGWHLSIYLSILSLSLSLSHTHTHTHTHTYIYIYTYTHMCVGMCLITQNKLEEILFIKQITTSIFSSLRASSKRNSHPTFVCWHK